MVHLPSNVFKVVPEGTNIFEITNVDYKAKFNKIEISMKNQDKISCKQIYSLTKQDGSLNEGALFAFSAIAKAATNDYSERDIDPNILVGCKIIADVTHDTVPSKTDPTKTFTYIKLSNVKPFTETAPVAEEDDDLDDIFGGLLDD